MAVSPNRGAKKQLDATARLVESNKLNRLKKASDLKDELMSEQKSVVNNIISSLNTATVVEKEAEQSLAAAKQAAVDKKQAAAKKAKSLFD